MPTVKHATAIAALQRIKAHVARELHDYPYPIAGCDEVFKTLVAQKECCRIALAGFNREDGLDAQDAILAVADLLTTPLSFTDQERHALDELVGRAVEVG